MDLELLRRAAQRLRHPGKMTVSQRIDLARELEALAHRIDEQRAVTAEPAYPKILACLSFPRRGMTVAHSVVLRDFGPQAFDRYVTHIRNDEDGGHTSGHYHKDEGDAMQDYLARAGRYSRQHYGEKVTTA